MKTNAIFAVFAAAFAAILAMPANAAGSYASASNGGGLGGQVAHFVVLGHADAADAEMPALMACRADTFPADLCQTGAFGVDLRRGENCEGEKVIGDNVDICPRDDAGIDRGYFAVYHNFALSNYNGIVSYFGRGATEEEAEAEALGNCMRGESGERDANCQCAFVAWDSAEATEETTHVIAPFVRSNLAFDFDNIGSCTAVLTPTNITPRELPVEMPVEMPTEMPDEMTETEEENGGGGSASSSDDSSNTAAYILGGAAVVGIAAYFLSDGDWGLFSATPDFGYSITESGYAVNAGGRVDFRKDRWHLYWTAGGANADGDFGGFGFASGGEYKADLWSAAFSEKVRSETADYDLSLSANYGNGVWKLSPVYRLHSRFERAQNGWESETENSLNLEGILRANRWTIRPTAGFQWQNANDFADNAKFGFSAIRNL